MIIKNILIYTAYCQGSLKILKKKERREGTGEKQVISLPNTWCLCAQSRPTNNWFKRIKTVPLQ